MNRLKMLVLSLTGQCNFSCRYCYASEHESRMMSTATALKAVGLAAASGEPFVLQFSGGEPLLNFPVLQNVVEYVRAHKIKAQLQLQTNASLVTDAIAKFLHDNAVGIGVSLDGRPQVNDRLRLLKSTGAGATRATVAGIEKFRRNNIAIGLTCVVTEENVHDLAGIVEFAYYLGNVRRIGFDLLRGQGRGAGLTLPSEKDMACAMKEVYAVNQRISRLTGYELVISQQERSKLMRERTVEGFGHCYALNGEAAFVDAKGDIYACASFVGNADFYLGNVEGGLKNELVEQVKEKIEATMSFCKECKDFALCGGGCFARWYEKGAFKQCLAECALKRSAFSKKAVKKG